MRAALLVVVLGLTLVPLGRGGSDSDSSTTSNRPSRDVSDLAGMSKAIVSITAALTSIDKSFTTMANSLVTLDPERELHTALNNAPSCDQVGG